MSRQRRPPLALPAPDMVQVLDMGLDFRSYLTRVDEHGAPVLGNVITYHASKVADTFEPTVGLLVTILHLYAQSSTVSTAHAWLKAYDTIQHVFLEQTDPNGDAARYAREARQVVATQLAAGVTRDHDAVCERLLLLLDAQSGIRGPQAPSQRKIAREPKGAFCNLHLADHKCFQEFACNQLHLHEAGPVRHRIHFFQQLARTLLLQEKRPRSEVVARLKDSVFFARYGNKVTVRCHGSWIPFFKTVYTDGRLEQAFRMQSYMCTDINCTNEHCRGVHAQDRRVPPSTKPMDLHNPQHVLAEISSEAEYIVASVEAMNDAPGHMLAHNNNSNNGMPVAAGAAANGNSGSLIAPGAAATAVNASGLPAATTAAAASLLPPMHEHAAAAAAALLRSPKGAMPSPTSELWRNTVRDYVRQSGVAQVEADESLLRTLQDTKITGTPLSASERMTPLLEELDMYAFDSSVSSVSSDFRH